MWFKCTSFAVGGLRNKVTDAGVADLQKVLPNCKIEK
jgi:hypothetical protein